MSYRHLSISDRGRIEALHQIGYSCRKIATELARHHSSISRELKRCAAKTNYKADIAQQDYEIKRINSRPNGKWNKELAQVVAEKLAVTWSPEQIANTVTLGQLSFKTIYTWLYAGKLEGLPAEVLRRKGKKKSCRNLAFFARGTSIRKRPKEVYARKTFGHWELDTVVSSRQSGGCLATFIERKTRLYTAIMMPDKTAQSMETAITYLYNVLPKKAFKTATTDRGGEFACFDNIKRKLGLTLYFADPYCPHQRGSNEYGNGLLREFYPKKTDLAKISQNELIHNLILINGRPRKCLQWKTPIQAFLHEVAQLN